MPNCTVRRHVRLIPKQRDALSIDAIGIFTEERAPNEQGEPGPLISRRLSNFSGLAGNAIRAMVTHGDEWDMDVQQRLDPLEWDS
jgi:hypothetical protein